MLVLTTLWLALIRWGASATLKPPLNTFSLGTGPPRLTYAGVDVGEVLVPPYAPKPHLFSQLSHKLCGDHTNNNVSSATVQVLTVLRSTDCGVVRSAAAPTGYNDRCVEVLSDMLQMPEQLEVYGVEAAAAVALKLFALEMRTITHG